MYENMKGWFVTVPEDVLGDVVGELIKRGGTVTAINNYKNMFTIKADVPFEWMVDFEYWLDKISKGAGSVIMRAANG
jgi:translation elongation factor EF-G